MWSLLWKDSNILCLYKKLETTCSPDNQNLWPRRITYAMKTYGKFIHKLRFWFVLLCAWTNDIFERYIRDICRSRQSIRTTLRHSKCNDYVIINNCLENPKSEIISYRFSDTPCAQDMDVWGCHDIVWINELQNDSKLDLKIKLAPKAYF